MQSPEFFKILSRVLRAQGVTARGEARLSAEYYDHYTCGVQSRMEQGMPPAEAEAASVAALGDPEYLAKAAAGKWRGRLWPNRHPWIFGLVGGMSANLLASLLFIIPLVVFFSLTKGIRPLPPGSPIVPVVVFICALTNWFPALAGGTWMGWQFRQNRFRPGTFWIGCLGIALGVSLFNVRCEVPMASYQGQADVMLGPIVGVLAWPFAELFHVEKQWGYGTWRPFIGTPTTWLQVSLTFAVAWAIQASRGFSYAEKSQLVKE